MLPRNLLIRIPKPAVNNFLKRNIGICVPRSENTAVVLLRCTSLVRSNFAVRATLNRNGFHTSSNIKQQKNEEKSQPRADESSNSKRGSLIPTKSHLFRLTLPLPSLHFPKDSSINEVSFLLHPSQPLSHLSSLIVAELPHRPNNQGQTQQLVTFHGFQDPDPEISGDEEEGVRWSGGTELGEFMRDAAKVREFTIKLNLDDNPDWEIRVSVPNFEDRTRYMREKFHEITNEINDLAKIKFECDEIAHQHTKHVAMGGFGVLVVYWGTIYYLTFQKYGWDIMEPITYLTGLGTAMVGYLWFLYHNRNVSYRSVFQQTTTQRQNLLYQQKGFDEDQWNELVTEGKKLGREIKAIGEQYGVKWNPKVEATGRAEGVLEKEDRKDKKAKKARVKEKEEEDEDDD